MIKFKCPKCNATEQTTKIIIEGDALATVSHLGTDVDAETWSYCNRSFATCINCDHHDHASSFRIYHPDESPTPLTFTVRVNITPEQHEGFCRVMKRQPTAETIERMHAWLQAELNTALIDLVKEAGDQ